MTISIKLSSKAIFAMSALLQKGAEKLMKNAYKDGCTYKYLTVKSLFSFDQGVVAYEIMHMTSAPKIFTITSLKDFIFQAIGPDIAERCKFPVLG